MNLTKPNFSKHIPIFCIPTVETTAHKDLTTTSPLNGSQFVYDAPSSPITQKSTSCTSNLQSACRLSLTTHRLYSQELALPAGVEAISVTPSAGEGQ